MAYKIIITELAEMDLASIVAYIVQALGNRIAAANLLNAVDYCYARLEEMPNMYETCTDAYLRAGGYRKARIKNYVMVYRVDDECKTVTVMRFFHTRQDYEHLI